MFDTTEMHRCWGKLTEMLGEVIQGDAAAGPTKRTSWYYIKIWMVPKMGGILPPKNGWFISWKTKPYEQLDDLGGFQLFLETLIYLK